MGRIQNDAEPIHLLEQFFSFGGKRTDCVRSMCVHSRSVMSRSKRPQTVRVTPFQMLQRDNRIGTFKTEDVTDRQLRGTTASVTKIELVVVWRSTLPSRNMPVQLGTVPNLHHLACFFHRSIPGELSLCLSPRLNLRIPTLELMKVRRMSRDLSGN